jgi:hypothetical protein
MIELATLSYVICSAVAVAISAGLWIEVRAFRELNEGLGAMIVEVQTTRNEMVAGIIGAINDRAAQDEKPKGTAH